MGLIFADSSALVKRHVAEMGSAWVRSWIVPTQDHTIIVSDIAIPEVLSAMARRQRQDQLSEGAFARLSTDFLYVAQEEYFIVPTTSAFVTNASELVVRHPLGTLDALHLAAALDYNRVSGVKPLFITADQRLLAAAAAEGFPTDNPNLH